MAVKSQTVDINVILFLFLLGVEGFYDKVFLCLVNKILFFKYYTINTGNNLK